MRNLDTAHPDAAAVVYFQGAGKAVEQRARMGLLDQVIEAAGVSKTTFYKHFESKDELMLAAVRLYDEWEMGAWGRAVAELAGDDPAAQLLGFFDVAERWFNDPSFGGCLFINTAAVVLEVGGELQHGALVAREYGKPCVAGIDQVTTQLHDGEIVEVDGNSGVVRMIASAAGCVSRSA